MVYHRPLTTVTKQLSFEPDNPSFAADVTVGMDTLQTDPIVQNVTQSLLQSIETDNSPEKVEKQSDNGNVRFVSEQEQGVEDSSDEVMVAYLVENCNSLVEEMGKLDSLKTGESGTDNLSDKATRKSTRIRSMSQRHVRSKILLEKIKQVKRKTAAAACHKNDRKLSGKPKKSSTKQRTKSHDRGQTKQKNEKQSMGKRADTESSINTKLKRKATVKVEAVDERSVKQPPNKRINVKDEVTLEQELDSEGPADVKPDIPCKHCDCVFQVTFFVSVVFPT